MQKFYWTWHSKQLGDVWGPKLCNLKASGPSHSFAEANPEETPHSSSLQEYEKEQGMGFHSARRATLFLPYADD